MIDGIYGTYFGYRGSENYYFVEFAYPLHKLVYTRPLNYVDVMILSFDLNRYCEVCLVQDLKRCKHVWKWWIWNSITLKLL